MPVENNFAKIIPPPRLRSGDTIALIAPAYHIEAHRWEPALPLLQSWGLQVKTGSSLRLRDGVFAGNDQQRLNDLVTMLCDPQIKAILCARGGYGCGRLLPGLERDSSSFTPKWLVGYSDVTALASFMVNRMRWQCIHGPMPIDMGTASPPEPPESLNRGSMESWNHLHHLLFGQPPEYDLPAHTLNRCGTATAPLIGGNLSVICSLNATPWQWQTAGCILFIEEVNEPLYHVDRMMNSLRTGGQLSRLKGLLVGAMTGMRDSEPSFGKSAYEIIAAHVEAYDYPVAFGFPAGHGSDRERGDVNNPLTLGANVRLQVTEHSVRVEQLNTLP